MSAGHTPGPWEVRGSRVYGDQSVASCQFIVRNTQHEDAEETIANARLIAAAPELLEACVDAKMTFEHYAELHAAKGTAEGSLKAFRNREMAQKLGAAILKATTDSSIGSVEG